MFIPLSIAWVRSSNAAKLYKMEMGVNYFLSTFIKLLKIAQIWEEEEDSLLIIAR